MGRVDVFGVKEKTTSMNGDLKEVETNSEAYNMVMWFYDNKLQFLHQIILLSFIIRSLVVDQFYSLWIALNLVTNSKKQDAGWGWSVVGRPWERWYKRQEKW